MFQLDKPSAVLAGLAQQFFCLVELPRRYNEMSTEFQHFFLTLDHNDYLSFEIDNLPFLAVDQ
jgi:hypothetical protein